MTVCRPTLALAWRTLRLSMTRPSIALPALLFPAAFFAGFVGGLSPLRLIRGFGFSGSYEAFVFVFVLLQSAAFTGVLGGVGIAYDLESGFAERLLLAAPRRSSIVAGYVVASLIRWVAVGGLLSAAAVITGMPIVDDGVDIGGLIALGALVNVATTLWAAGVALRLPTVQASPVIQLPVFIFLFLAPVYVPLRLLTGWMRSLAGLNPTSVVLAGGRAFISGAGRHWPAFAIALAAVCLLAIWASRGLARVERR